MNKLNVEIDHETFNGLLKESFGNIIENTDLEAAREREINDTVWEEPPDFYNNLLKKVKKQEKKSSMFSKHVLTMMLILLTILGIYIVRKQRI